MTMTREEAIQILESMSDISTQGEAIDMAIKALSKPINCVKCKHYYETEDDTDVHGHCRMDTAHTDIISRTDAINAVCGIVIDEFDISPTRGYEVAEKAFKALPSADTEQGYTEWLEKIIVDNEGANGWLCENTPDLEWCEKNCSYTSIQAECLRHLYEVNKEGEDDEID